MVSAFSRSWGRRRELRKEQITLKLPEHQLIGDVATRWGSKAAMIGRYLEQEEAVRRVLSPDRKASHLLPTWQTLDVLKSINEALSPLAEFTNMLSGETYVTISMVVPLLSILQDITDEAKADASTTALTREILDSARGYLMNCYQKDQLKEFLAIATFLDPRYKASFLSTEESDYNSLEKIKIKVIDEANRLALAATPAATSALVDETVEQPPAKKMSLTDRLKKKTVKQIADAGPMTSVHSEIEIYLSTPCESLTTDILLWWKSSSLKHLSVVSRKFLCVTATSTPSERLFSTAGGIITSKRNRLNPQLAEQLIFLNRNA